MKMWPSNPSDESPEKKPEEGLSAPSGAWWDDTWNDVPEPRFTPRRGAQRPRGTSWYATMQSIKRVIRFMRHGGILPRYCDDQPWIYATERTGERLIDPALVGKWLIFVPEDQVNATWALIDEAHSDAKLGIDAKVSTAMVRNVEGTHVICVYTEDWTDADDVWRVREALRDLGFTQKLYYKRDQDTRAGKRTHTYQG